jgi:hypothetical protein
VRAHGFSFLLLIACHDDPWTSQDAPKVRPDEEFRTGTEAGFDVWIWHCYEGQRIVIMQHGSAFFGAGRPQTTTGPCGAPLSVESKFPPSERQNEIPEGYRWP